MAVSPDDLPRDHRQILVNVADGIAVSNPETVFAEIPRDPTTYEHGFWTITYRDFANAINGLAWWLKDTLGPAKDFETVCYVGGNDIRYQALMLACVKVGYKLFFTSPRNSMAAHLHLFKETGCQTMVAPDPPPPFVPPIVEAGGLKLLKAPSLDDLLNKDYPHFEYSKTFNQAKDDPLVVLHTSGTTGMPKPIIWTHDWAAAWWSWNNTPTPHGFARFYDRYVRRGYRMFLALPPFHAGNLFCSLLATIWSQLLCVYYAGAIPSGRSLVEAMKYTKIDIALGAPPLLEDIGKDDELLDAVSQNLDGMIFVGGDLSQPVGRKILNRMTMFTVIGATEMGTWPSIYPVDDSGEGEWKYFQFGPEAMIEFELQSDNLFEAVAKRHPDPEKLSPAFKIFPDQEEYRSKDLFSPHPTKPGLWSYVGRVDDIIVFLNGEKTNPTSFEFHVAHRPEVKAALVVGTLRFQPALLIEPAADKPLSTVEKAELIEKIWPTIKEANQDCPQYARVSKSFIFFTDHAKPMERAGKGTVQRRLTLEKYAKEIDAWYADAEKVAISGAQVTGPAVDAHNHDQVFAVVQKSVADIIGWADLKEEDDLVAHGMDSLKALELTRDLKKKIGVPDLDIVTVYLNASIAALSRAIVNLADHGKASKQSVEQTKRKALEDSLIKHTEEVNMIASAISGNPSPPLTSKVGRVVALTGSTGALGSYTLQALIDQPSVTHVYCLNRAADSNELQISRNRARGLSTDFPPEKVTFLKVDLAQPKFGLEGSVYSKLQSEITDIIHNAWTVNFNFALTAFQYQLSGVVNLISFAATASTKPSILFVSSVAAVSGPSLQTRPEEILKDVSAPSSGGYGESKWLAERILDHAATKIPYLQVKIARIGQLTGAAFKSGGWNKVEWFPTLITSSYHLEAIPNTLGFKEMLIDWVPIDVQGNALVDFVLSKTLAENSGARVLNPTNPHPISWDDLLPSILNVFKAKKDVKLVSYDEWLKLVKADAESWDQSQLEGKLENNPAVKLMGTYEIMRDKTMWPRVSGEKAYEESENLQRLNCIKGEWMQRWVKDWI